MINKLCTKCNTTKEILQFTTKTGKVTNWCKQCLCEAQKKWRSKEENCKRIYLQRKQREIANPELKRKAIEQSRAEYQRHREKYKQNFEKYRKKNPEAIRKANQKWKQKNKNKLCVHTKVKYRVDRGIIIKPENCQSCGVISKLEAHHEDYEKPFEIIWLCTICHGKTRLKKDIE